MRTSKKNITADLSASVNGGAIAIDWLNGYSLVVSWTGTPTGTLKLQGSNDAWDEDSQPTQPEFERSAATWVDIAGSSTVTGGAAGSFSWNAADQNYQAVRLVYVRTGGTGSLTGIFRGKSVS